MTENNSFKKLEIVIVCILISPSLSLSLPLSFPLRQLNDMNEVSEKLQQALSTYRRYSYIG